MLLSIIVPVYNEEKTIAFILERLLALDLGKTGKEIIVVNDGSTDGTRRAFEMFVPHISCVEHAKNCGKGAALRTGLAQAKGEAVIVQDGDLEYNPVEIKRLLAVLYHRPDIAAVYGSRNLAPTKRGYSHCVFGVWLLTACINLLFRSRLSDSYTCYKLVRADALKALSLRQDGFEVEMEITAKLLKRGLKIREVPISYHPRSFEEGKKIRAIDGIKGLLLLVRIFLARATALSPQRAEV